MASFWICLLLVNFGAVKLEFLKCNSENHGQVGHQSILECVVIPTEGTKDVQIMHVFWRKVESDSTVFSYTDKIERAVDERFQFAELGWNNRNMNVSMLLTNTTIDDIGNYTCKVMTDSAPPNTRRTVLRVTASYDTPTITISNKTDIQKKNTMTLHCNSGGGYPEGKILWSDEHNNNLTNKAELKVTKTVDGRFNLTSKLVLPQGSSATSFRYTCTVNSTRGEEGHAEYNVPSGRHSPGHGLDLPTKVAAPLVVIGSLIIGLLALILLLLKRRRQGPHQIVNFSDPDGIEGEDHQQDAIA